MGFSDDISKLVEVYKGRIDNTVKQATQDTVAEAQRVTGEGGRMRVDTGFLRASGGAALDSPPTGPTEVGDLTITGQLTGEPLPVVLAKWRPGQDIYFGWSANYARAREAKDGFARGAAEKWPEKVRAAADRAKRKG